ncbi:MAG: DNA polymerase III subunit gamma/tau, partial [Candidatus Theseobacter exili]|nr:DNA polymerase III subunit gamma/tau [Candidatus Theseobacter exili]
MSEYEVLARKWRPTTFEEIVGQNHVSKTLQNAIEMNRIGHAYLFVGSRGIGKTSTARVFAKALNCEKGPSKNPCNQCAFCREIKEGNSMDVLEIDGASNRGIDEIRELRENVKFAPAKGRFKIYIIDEVHMLTPQAFNALLKTLEEPPGHVKFFFATTKPESIPATILSRCQRFDLRRLSIKEISTHLQTIAESEGITIEQKALRSLARGADGSLRDAESLFDQLISFCGEKIDYDNTVLLLGQANQEQVSLFVDGILESSAEKSISIVKDLEEKGKDLGVFIKDVTAYLRDLIVAKEIAKPMNLLNVDKDETENLRTKANRLSVAVLLHLLDLFIETGNTIKRAGSDKILLESAIFKSYRIVQGV